MPVQLDSGDALPAPPQQQVEPSRLDLLPKSSTLAVSTTTSVRTPSPPLNSMTGSTLPPRPCLRQTARSSALGGEDPSPPARPPVTAAEGDAGEAPRDGCVAWAGWLAFLIFGISPWLLVNGIFTESSLLSKTAPEGRKISAYLGAVVQIGNLVPFLYVALQSRGLVTERSSVFGILIVNVGVGVLLALFWKGKVDNESFALLVLAFAAGMVGCLSKVTWFPFASHYRDAAINATSTGMGLSGILTIALGALQGAGEDSQRFSFSVFCIILTGLNAVAVAAFLSFCGAGPLADAWREAPLLEAGPESPDAGCDSQHAVGAAVAIADDRDGGSTQHAPGAALNRATPEQHATRSSRAGTWRGTPAVSRPRTTRTDGGRFTPGASVAGSYAASLAHSSVSRGFEPVPGLIVHEIVQADGDPERMEEAEKANAIGWCAAFAACPQALTASFMNSLLNYIVMPGLLPYLQSSEARTFWSTAAYYAANMIGRWGPTIVVSYRLYLYVGCMWLLIAYLMVLATRPDTSAFGTEDRYLWWPTVALPVFLFSLLNGYTATMTPRTIKSDVTCPILRGRTLQFQGLAGQVGSLSGTYITVLLTAVHACHK